MTDDSARDTVDFDPELALALAIAADRGEPPAHLKERLMARLAEPPLPAGFSVHRGHEGGWRPHPVPGIRMKLLALNRVAGYAALLLDVAPGTRFPAHSHTGDEECLVLSGSLFTCGRRLAAGDFVHADAETDHDELWTEEGCRVLLVVPPEDYMSEPSDKGSGTRDKG
jgi:anti-sigma factor ChrR (cupin superfamily)